MKETPDDSRPMIDAYLARSPAAMKVAIALEELELPYQVVPICVVRGDQFAPGFRRLSPNSKVPVIVDPRPTDGGIAQVVFESGAILLYLAEKSGRFLPIDPRSRLDVIQWLFWQAAGLSPMSGQAVHFLRYAPPDASDYARERYTREVNRLYGVLNHHLAGRECIAGEYGIADMATYPWTRYADTFGQNLEEFPHLARWRTMIGARPAVVRAYQRIEETIAPVEVTEEERRRNLFGHTARSSGLIP